MIRSKRFDTSPPAEPADCGMDCRAFARRRARVGRRALPPDMARRVKPGTDDVAKRTRGAILLRRLLRLRSHESALEVAPQLDLTPFRA